MGCLSYPREWSQPRDRPVSLAPPALAGEFFTTSATWEAPNSLQFSSVQSLSHVRLFATLWTAAHQASMNTSFKFLLGRDRFSLCILQISLISVCHNTNIISLSYYIKCNLKKNFIFDYAGSLLLHRLFSRSGKRGLLSSCVWHTGSHCRDFSCCGGQDLGCRGFRSCGSQTLEHMFNSCDT